MVWKYRECLPDVPLARDIPKIGKFNGCKSPSQPYIGKRTADGNGVRSDSASKGSLRQSTDLTYRNLILRHMSVGKSAKQDKAL